MSEWRTRIAISEWRVRKRQLPQSGDCIYALEAKVWSTAWEEFGRIDMDCAGEGRGQDIADAIVDVHNHHLKCLDLYNRAQAKTAKTVPAFPSFDRLVASVLRVFPDLAGADHARRTAACVNFCRPLATEWLEKYEAYLASGGHHVQANPFGDVWIFSPPPAWYEHLDYAGLIPIREVKYE